MTTPPNPPDPPSVRAARALNAYTRSPASFEHQKHKLIAEIIARETSCDSLSSENERARGLLKRVASDSLIVAAVNGSIREKEEALECTAEITAFLSGKGGV